MKFNTGDLVKYAYNGGEIRCRVFAVVPPLTQPRAVVKSRFFDKRPQKLRDVESYLIENLDRPAQRWLHWPRVEKLQAM